MSDILPKEEPTFSGQVTQLDDGHSSDVTSEVALALTIGLFVCGIWVVVNLRKGVLKNKLKLPFTKLKSLFKNEWAWRLFLVFQIIGLLGIACLAIVDNDWHLFPYTSSINVGLKWDFLNSQFWTEYYENWFVTGFIVAPFLVCKAVDWIFAAKGKTWRSNSLKNN